MRQKERLVQREGRREGKRDREGGERDKSKLEQSKRFREDHPRQIKFCCTCLF